MKKQLSLGIDIGGTKIKSIIYNYKDKKIVKECEQKYQNKPPSEEEFTSVLWGTADAVLKDIPLESLAGIGVGTGGIIAENRIYASEILGVLNSFPLKKEIEKRYSFLPEVVNDVQSGILSEWHLGPYANAKSFLMIIVSTGMNIAYIKDGKLQHGAFDRGHAAWGVTMDIEAVKRGERGDMERFTSEIFFKERSVTPADAAKDAQNRDKKMIELWGEYGQNLGIALASFINILEPEVVVFGGGISKSWSLFSDTMKKTAKNIIVSELARDKTIIEPASFGTDAGSVGAALLPHLK